MKTYKLFGITVLEIFDDKEELPIKKVKDPKGAVLDYTPEEIQREKEKEILKKYE